MEIRPWTIYRNSRTYISIWFVGTLSFYFTIWNCNWNNITISISHLNDEDNFIFVDRFATSFSSLHDISIWSQVHIFVTFNFYLILISIPYLSDVHLMFLLELFEMGTWSCFVLSHKERWAVRLYSLRTKHRLGVRVRPTAAVSRWPAWS